MVNVIIIGAGSHGRVVADIVQLSGDKVLGFLDDSPKSLAETAGFPYLGRIDTYTQYENAQFIIAIGAVADRRRIAQELQGVVWYTAIHPTATISRANVQIGAGSVVTAGAIINPGAHIGKHCIINTAAVVEHDSVVGDFVHISVGAKLAGTVTLGAGTWVSIGAIISNNLSVCENSTIGAGAVVVSDISESGVYVGVPARKIR